MSQIRNVAAELAIRKAVEEIPGYTCVSIKAQSDFYLVSIESSVGVWAIRVSDASEARRQLSR